MIKTGKVEIGQTPSTVLGVPCTDIQDGEPVARGEVEPADPGLKKLAALLEEQHGV